MKQSEAWEETGSTQLALGDGCGLQASREPDGTRWYFLFSSPTGEPRSIPMLNEGAPTEDQQNSLLNRWSERVRILGNPLIAHILLPLISLAKRPSHYGCSRERLEEMRDNKDVLGILMLSPVSRTRGYWLPKVHPAPGVHEVFAELIAKHELAPWIILSLTQRPVDTKVVSLRLPVDIYNRLSKEAWPLSYSNAQMIQAILRARYSSD